MVEDCSLYNSLVVFQAAAPLCCIHCTSTVHCALSTVHCALSAVHCPLCTVHFTLCTVWWVLMVEDCFRYNSLVVFQATAPLCCIHCASTVHCALSTVHCPLCIHCA